MTHREALEALVKRLDEVHADPQYRGVWQMHMIHGGRYSGLTYTAELKAAHEALTEDNAVDDALDICQRELAQALKRADTWEWAVRAKDKQLSDFLGRINELADQLTAIREAAEPIIARLSVNEDGSADDRFRRDYQQEYGDLRGLLEAIGPAEPPTLRCETCRTEMRASAFKGECPVCGNGTVREIEGTVAL